MKTLLAVFTALILMFAFHGLQAQTSSVPPVQQPNAPCGVVASSSVKPASGSAPKLSDDAKKKLKQKTDWIQKYIPFQLPDPTAPADKAKPTLPPCPPTSPNPQIVPVLKLPSADFSITLRCNPLVAPPKGIVGGTTGFTLPDPHQYGLPETNQLEADSATPDVNAKTPCYQLKVNPKTNKYFVAAQ